MVFFEASHVAISVVNRLRYLRMKQSQKHDHQISHESEKRVTHFGSSWIVTKSMKQDASFLESSALGTQGHLLSVYAEPKETSWYT